MLVPRLFPLLWQLFPLSETWNIHMYFQLAFGVLYVTTIAAISSELLYNHQRNFPTNNSWSQCLMFRFIYSSKPSYTMLSERSFETLQPRENDPQPGKSALHRLIIVKWLSCKRFGERQVFAIFQMLRCCSKLLDQSLPWVFVKKGELSNLNRCFPRMPGPQAWSTQNFRFCKRMVLLKLFLYSYKTPPSCGWGHECQHTVLLVFGANCKSVFISYGLKKNFRPESTLSPLGVYESCILEVLLPKRSSAQKRARVDISAISVTNLESRKSPGTNYDICHHQTT